MTVIDRRRLARLMAIQGVSARRLAMAAGWKSHSYMNRLINGQARTLETEPARRIAQFLRVNLDDLFVPTMSTDVTRQSNGQQAS